MVALLIKLCRGFPHWIRNGLRYSRMNRSGTFRITRRDLAYYTYQRYNSAGSLDCGYFHQDLWAARIVFARRIKELVDVGSRLDGFVAHVIPFCHVQCLDIRPPPVSTPGLTFVQADAAKMPFADNSVDALSCLHVIEHIGLGRCGDPVDPEGYLHVAREFCRVIKPGGILLLGTPVGQERLCFDAHRVFDPQTIADAFGKLRLIEFSLIDDAGMGVTANASFEVARKCRTGCGLFLFEKSAAVSPRIV